MGLGMGMDTRMEMGLGLDTGLGVEMGVDGEWGCTDLELELGWPWDAEGRLWALGGAQLCSSPAALPTGPKPAPSLAAQPCSDTGNAALPCSTTVHGLSCSKPGANKPYRDICYYS